MPMRHSSIALFFVLLILAILDATSASAQTTLEATLLFATEDGGERNGLAYESSTARIYTVSNTVELRAYTLAGTKVSGPEAITSGGVGVSGRSGETGIHFVEEAVTIGSTGVAAGTLVFIQAGASNDPLDLNETTLYALDAITGAAFASESVDTGILVPPAGCGDVLKDVAKGLGYSAARDRFLTIDLACQGVAEIENGDALGFVPVPGGILGTSGGAGVAVHPVTGHTWVGGAIQGLGTNVLAEFDENGAQLGSFAVVESGTTTPVVLRRLSFDATGDRLFVLTFGAEVFEIATPKAPAVPGLEALGRVALLITTFAVTGLGLRAGRADAASRPQRPGPDPS